MRVQIVMAGIGGQGILFLSKIFSHLGLNRGLNVLGSETHGMSQRGGSVTAFIKIGDFHSALIRAGSADFLYSLEFEEMYRALQYIRKGGVCFVNLSSLKRFAPEILDYLQRRKIQILAFDASQTALEQGSVLSTNIALLGYSVGTGLIPYKRDEIERILSSLSTEKNRAVNLCVFDAGYAAGQGIAPKKKLRL